MKALPYRLSSVVQGIIHSYFSSDNALYWAKSLLALIAQFSIKPIITTSFFFVGSKRLKH